MAAVGADVVAVSERYAVLNPDHTLRFTDDVHEWGRMFDSFEDRNVAQDEVGGYGVSTVFLGLDHSFGRGPKQWFETMLFAHGDDKSRDEETHRYETWDEALAGHKALVAELSA